MSTFSQRLRSELDKYVEQRRETRCTRRCVDFWTACLTNKRNAPDDIYIMKHMHSCLDRCLLDKKLSKTAILPTIVDRKLPSPIENKSEMTTDLK